MNKAQARHAASIGKHLAQYTQPALSQFQAWERAKAADLEHVSTQQFENDVNQYVNHLAKELAQVIKDMMGDLHVQ